jgi:hypothetical protein
MKEFVDALSLITEKFSEAVLDSGQSVHGGQHDTTLLAQQ